MGRGFVFVMEGVMGRNFVGKRRDCDLPSRLKRGTGEEDGIAEGGILEVGGNEGDSGDKIHSSLTLVTNNTHLVSHSMDGLRYHSR